MSLDFIASTNAGHPALDRWDAQLNKIAPAHGVPPNLLKAFILYESGGDANVISFDKGVGLCQITAGVDWHNGTPLYEGMTLLNPAWNMEVACRFFIKPNLVRFPTNLDAVIASYNAGPGAVQQALNAGKSVETVTYHPQYVGNVRGAYQWFNGVSHKELKK